MLRPPTASPSAIQVAPQRAPITTPFFYGWVIVACVSTAAFVGSGVTNVVMSLMLKPISEETGWSRTMISIAISSGLLAGGLVSPPVGHLADRYGARMLIPPAGFISGLMYLAIAYVTAFPVFFLTYVVNRAVTSSAMGGVVDQAAVANWFYYRRPRAMGVVGMVGALGGTVMALVAQVLMEYASWRAVMVVYGVLTLLLVVTPSALLLRRRPEDLGLTLDGFRPAQAAAVGALWVQRTGRSSAEEYNWSLSEVVRTRVFWLIIASMSLTFFAIASVGVHQVAYYTDRGIAPAVAAIVLSVYTFSSAASSLLWGFLTERFDERLLNVGALLLAAAAIWFLTLVDNPFSALIFAIGYGLFARGEGTLINILMAQYYGRQNFGVISGFARPFQAASGALGPVVAALTFDFTNSYIGVFYALFGVLLVAALLMFLARRPIAPGR